MRFKVGDKVKVRKDLKNGYFSIYDLEDYQNDKIFTIESERKYKLSGYVYKLLEDNKINYDFRGDMLIPAEEEIILKAIKNEQGFYEIRMPKEIKVYSYGRNRGGYEYINCIKKVEILDDIEKEYLRAVIKPFRDRVKNIEKAEDCIRNEFITLNIKSINGFDERIALPYFKRGTMYKNMITDKKYSLEELGL